ncbi:hypothetical protein EOA30_32975, partial [Mesorhizobium sp. M8A.F.Ca.ET.059.01.1.1]
MIRHRVVLCSACFWISAFTLLALPNYAEAECDARSFAVQHINDIRATGETELAFVLTATNEEFNAAKKDHALSGPYNLISLSKTYTEAREKALQIASVTNFDRSSSYALSYFLQLMPASALADYENCLKATIGLPGLRIWLGGKQGDYLIFNAFWVGKNVVGVNVGYDAQPIVDGGIIVSKPERWYLGKTEQIVVKRIGNNDVFIQLNVGGESGSQVIVRDPPQVTWDTQPVISDTVMRACSHGPNPGCSAGQVKDCIYPKRPGGHFIQGSHSVTQFSSSDPTRNLVQFDTDTPEMTCVKITQ